MRVMIIMMLGMCVGCGDVFEEPSSCPSEQSEAQESLDVQEPRTLDGHIEKYGFGASVVDAYYLPESSAGTRLVVEIELANEREPQDLSFGGILHDSDATVETQGAGNILSFYTKNFEEEYEPGFVGCMDSHGQWEIATRGSIRCHLLFHASGKTFTQANALRLIVGVGKSFADDTELVLDLPSEPRRL
jgi:hypothetical protein